MKKYLLLITVFIICILTFISCQPTPDNQIVRSKNAVSAQGPELNQKSQEQSLNDRLAVPLEWRESIPLNEKLIVDINADIIVPQVTDVATYEVAPKEITQEIANEYIGALFGDAILYEQRPHDILTQEDIINQVADIKDFLDRLKIDDPDRHSEEVDYWNGMIKELLKTLGNYPETYELKLSDGKFQTAKKYEEMLDGMNPDMWMIAIQADLGKKNPARLNIEQSESLKDGTLFFSNTNTLNASEIRLKLNEVQNPIELTVPFNDALELAEKQLNELGLNNYSLQEAYYGVFSDGAYVTSSIPIKERNSYFYSMYFSQTKDSIPMSYTSSFSGVPVEKMVSEPWEPELIQINIDNDGIFAVVWLMPTTIGEVINYNVDLLDFENIRKIILDSLKYLYTLPPDVTTVEKIELHVDKIEFAYTRCLKQNSQNEYILTPCWNIYGSVQTYYNEEVTDPNNDENNSYIDSRPMGNLITINAMNGSLLNDMGF